jgi:hypothetical protein
LRHVLSDDAHLLAVVLVGGHKPYVLAHCRSGPSAIRLVEACVK